MTPSAGRLLCLLLVAIPTGFAAGQSGEVPGGLSGVAGRAGSQTDGGGDSESRVASPGGLFGSIYALDGPAWTALFGAADAGALPIVFGAAPVLAIGRWVEGDGRYDDAWRAGLSVTIGLGLSTAIKHAVHRDRPFAGLPGVTAKSRYVGARHLDRYSFPSTHATLAAALATSLALSHPEWYVVVPAAVWVGAVGVSRVWLGVHYPGDVVTGWALGAAVAWTIHRLGDRLTPNGLYGPSARSTAPILSVRF